MRRFVISAFGAVIVLAAATGAAGKAPPSGIEICGQGACKTIAGVEAERIVIVALSGSDAEPAAPAPFFLVRWQWDDRPEQRVWWVPRGGLVRGLEGGWSSQSVASEAALRAAAAGLQPFAVPTLTRVVVGTRVAENPQSYLRLLRGGTLVWSSEDAGGWRSVQLTSTEPSPWTNWSGLLMVSKRGGWISRDGWIYRVPKALAERARHGRSITPFSRAG